MAGGDVPPLGPSLKHAYTSRDLSGDVGRSFVTAWERAHLDRTGYFDDHPVLNPRPAQAALIIGHSQPFAAARWAASMRLRVEVLPMAADR